jgi:hypothetical protein
MVSPAWSGYTTISSRAQPISIKWLRWVENPRDAIAAFRVLQLLPGVGRALARDALVHLSVSGWDFASLNVFPAPKVSSVRKSERAP